MPTPTSTPTPTDREGDGEREERPGDATLPGPSQPTGGRPHPPHARTERTQADPAPPSQPTSSTPHPTRARTERTSQSGTATIQAARQGDATVLTVLRPATPWAPRPLRSATRASAEAEARGTARVALVQTAATLLSGDDCGIDVRLGPGASLELIELGATVAHHVRDGAPAVLRVRIELGAGARLRWLACPLVLAEGCDLLRETHVTLAEGAQALLRETVVLGRSGQPPGALRGTTRATCAGRPLLHEQLDTREPALLRSPLVAGSATILDAVLLLGARGAELPGSSQLAGPGSVWRALHPRGTDPDPPALAVLHAWSSHAPTRYERPPPASSTSGDARATVL